MQYLKRKKNFTLTDFNTQAVTIKKVCYLCEDTHMSQWKILGSLELGFFFPEKIPKQTKDFHQMVLKQWDIYMEQEENDLNFFIVYTKINWNVW